MLNKLPSDFSMKRYGLSVRLVRENDTPFIMQLRTNENLSRFIHRTDSDVSKHLLWLQSYLEREADGRDYYFIYFEGNRPVGLNRIYNIYEYYGTIGSWICSPDNEPEVSLKTYFFMLDILFECLNLELSIFDVRKSNKKVWKLHKSVGAQQIGQSEVDYYFSLNKPDYLRHREELLSIFNISL